MNAQALMTDQEGVLGTFMAHFASRILIIVVRHVLVLLALVVLWPNLDFILTSIVVVPSIFLLDFILRIVVIDGLRFLS